MIVDENPNHIKSNIKQKYKKIENYVQYHNNDNILRISEIEKDSKD